MNPEEENVVRLNTMRAIFSTHKRITVTFNDSDNSRKVLEELCERFVCHYTTYQNNKVIVTPEFARKYTGGLQITVEFYPDGIIYAPLNKPRSPGRLRQRLVESQNHIEWTSSLGSLFINMPECKNCGPSQSAFNTKTSQSEKNPGRDFFSCATCGSFSGWADGQKAPGKSFHGPRSFNAPRGSFKVFPSPGKPQYFPDAQDSQARDLPSSQPIDIPNPGVKRPREDVEYHELPAKRPRSEESCATLQLGALSETLLNVLAGVTTIMNRFDQAATKFESMVKAANE